MLLLVLLLLVGSAHAAAPHDLQFNPILPDVEIDLPANLDRLSSAVSMAETSGCKTGSAVEFNNCHGIMAWRIEEGVRIRYPRTFASHVESHAAFKSLWNRKYGGRFPTYADAKLYTGGDSPDDWLRTVGLYYHSATIKTVAY